MPYDSLATGRCMRGEFVKDVWGQCSQPIADKGSGLCKMHSIELQHMLLNADPAPVLKQCAVCKQPISYMEARVLRLAQDPDAKSPSRVTPLLCWVCVRLHNSAGFSMERDLKAC